jgi:hypothetical protein
VTGESHQRHQANRYRGNHTQDDRQTSGVETIEQNSPEWAAYQGWPKSQDRPNSHGRSTIGESVYEQHGRDRLHVTPSRGKRLAEGEQLERRV